MLINATIEKGDLGNALGTIVQSEKEDLVHMDLLAEPVQFGIYWMLQTYHTNLEKKVSGVEPFWPMMLILTGGP